MVIVTLRGCVGVTLAGKVNPVTCPLVPITAPRATGFVARAFVNAQRHILEKTAVF